VRQCHIVHNYERDSRKGDKQSRLHVEFDGNIIMNNRIVSINRIFSKVIMALNDKHEAKGGGPPQGPSERKVRQALRNLIGGGSRRR